MPKVVITPRYRVRERRRVHAGLVRRRGPASSTFRARARGPRCLTRHINGDGHCPGWGHQPDTGHRSHPTSGWTGSRPRRRPSLRSGHRDVMAHPAMKQPTGAMGPAGLPSVEVALQSAAGRLHPCCPAQSHNHAETLSPRAAPSPAWPQAPELDDALRPRFGGCSAHRASRAATAPASRQFELPTAYFSDPPAGSSSACKGPVVKCNVPVRGWSTTMGGCRTSAAICMPARCPASPTSHAVHGRGPLGRRGRES